MVYSIIADIAEAELAYHNKLNTIMVNAMKTYKKSNLTTQHKTQNVITNVIKNIIEWLALRSNIQKKHSDVLDAEVREKMKMTMDTLDKSINNLEIKINDVKKGLKDVRRSDGDLQKAKKD